MVLNTKQGFLFLLLAVFFLAGVSIVHAASLTTTFAGGNGQNGNMFEISAINSVTIMRFDGNLDPPSGNYRIYYKVGTYTGFENNPGAWTLVGTANNVISNGEDVPTPIPINVNVAIPAGQTYSFYITTEPDEGVGYTDGTSEHAVYISDSNIEIKEGLGVEYPFGGTYSPRIWNGTVYYELGGITAVPTMTEWGMIIFMMLAGLGSVYYLRRQRKA